jgi:hypothetical protein
MRQLAGAFHFHLPEDGELATLSHLPTPVTMVGTADTITTEDTLHSTAACTQPDTVGIRPTVPPAANLRVHHATLVVQPDADQATVVQATVVQATVVQVVGPPAVAV